jgi:DNA-binding NtrC family response regulator
VPKDRRRKTLLIIDDERGFCESLTDYLQGERLAVLSAHTGAAALEICARTRVDVALLDQKLPDGEGHALAPAILERNDRTKIIFITAFPSFENAVKAVRTGAHDYLSKPLDLEELKITVERMLRMLDLEQAAQLHAFEQDRERARAVIIGGDGGLAGVEGHMLSAARSSAPVLITGETGTGKSLVARSIHYLSDQADAPFIDINCASLPESLIEAELFGYEKGSFTGASTAKRGLFEMADGGTLLLDEIGELPIHLQTKLLHALESEEVRRIGGTSARRIKVRIIAATNAEIETALGTAFRRDLYYRLNVIRIHIPPLRERPGDIPALCDHLLKQLPRGMTLSLAPGELELIERYPWPGNVRELRNVLERAALMQQGGQLRPSLLIGGPPETRRESPSGGGSDETPQLQHDLTLAEAEQRLITGALDRHGGNIARTAKALDISLSTLKRRLRAYRSR